MTTIFPFNHPAPTAFYLSVYILTLALHVVFMNYVLAGTTYLAIRSIFARENPESNPVSRPIPSLLRDWLPFATSAAITAGIAPLLFVQILYKTRFYTANLLLFNRWMSILPVLILGFYLLYLLKSHRIIAAPRPIRALITLAAFTCFAFTAFSWTENHLLGLDNAAWTTIYAQQHLFYRNLDLVPRLLVWFTGAFAVLPVHLVWQLRAATHSNLFPAEALATAFRQSRALALLGILLSSASALAYFFRLHPDLRHALLATTTPHLVVGALTLLLAAALWIALPRETPSRPRLILISVATLLAILAATIVRESIRIASIDFSALYPDHDRAYRVAGLTTFLLFFLVNALLIALCIRLARSAPRSTGRSK